MAQVKRGMDVLFTDEKRRKMIKDIIDFYATERDEEIGAIAADALLIKNRLLSSESDMNALVKK